MKKKIILVIAIVIAVEFGYFYVADKTADTIPALEYVTKNITSSRTFEDFAERELGIKSIDDITYTQNEKEIVLKLGKLTIPIQKDTIKTGKVKDYLDQIGLRIGENKDGHVMIKYLGDTVKDLTNE